MDVAIKITGLTKKFGDFVAVNNLDVEVKKGDIYGFLGPNGSGKSTTLRILLGLIKPTHGTIEIFNKNIQTQRRECMKHIGCIIEKPDFYTYLTAQENLSMHARACNIKYTQQQYNELYALVGLQHRQYDKVKTYSHGMKQRLGIAQTLLHNPDLIILDEPNTGLDPQGIIDLRNIILTLNKEQGKTVLFSSHILSEVQEVCTALIVINKGKTEVQGSVDALLRNADMLVKIEVEHMDVMEHCIANSAWKEKLVEQEGTHFVFKLQKNEIATLNTYLTQQGVRVSMLDYKKELEDYFLKITQAH